MGVKNTHDRYGAIAQVLHWLMAFAIFGLFALGLWMTSLDYGSAWYTKAPMLHEGIGMAVLAALLFRLLWRMINILPDDSQLKPWERTGAAWAHWGMYVLMAAVLVSGYLISTGGGRPVAVFDILSVPSIVSAKQLPDQAGQVHYYTAFALIGLALLHTLAALKHHFINKDVTLRRMLPGSAGET